MSRFSIVSHSGARARAGVVTVLAALVLLVWIVGGALAVDVFGLRHVYDFTWETPQGQCKAVRLAEPMISQSRIRTFAGDAAVSFFSFDYYNYEAAQNSALRQYGTIGGRIRIAQAVSASGLYNSIREKRAAAVAILRSPPNIKAEGKDFGRYYWEVEVQLRVFYEANDGMVVDDRMLIMTVVRVAPSPENPNGIGIDGFLSQTDGSGEYLR